LSYAIDVQGKIIGDRGFSIVSPCTLSERLHIYKAGTVARSARFGRHD